jgi:hypothetical protein
VVWNSTRSGNVVAFPPGSVEGFCLGFEPRTASREPAFALRGYGGQAAKSN